MNALLRKIIKTRSHFPIGLGADSVANAPASSGMTSFAFGRRGFFSDGVPKICLVAAANCSLSNWICVSCAATNRKVCTSAPINMASSLQEFCVMGNTPVRRSWSGPTEMVMSRSPSCTS